MSTIKIKKSQIEYPLNADFASLATSATSATFSQNAQNHINNTTNAHVASSITTNPTYTGLSPSATNLEDALKDIKQKIGTSSASPQVIDYVVTAYDTTTGIIDLGTTYITNGKVLNVFYNQGRLTRNIDYQEYSNTSVKFLFPLQVGDNITFVINTSILSEVTYTTYISDADKLDGLHWSTGTSATGIKDYIDSNIQILNTNIQTVYNNIQPISETTVKQLTRPEIVKIAWGQNRIFFLTADGHVFSAGGTNGDYSYISGFGDYPYFPFSLNNIKQIPFTKTNGISPSPIIDIGVCGVTAYALSSNGVLYGWGYNGHGQLGDDSTNHFFIPKPIAFNVKEIYTHPSSYCYEIYKQQIYYKDFNDNLYGCGYNEYGQLGLGHYNTPVKTFQLITTNVKKAWNLGSKHGCLFVQKNDNTIWACGYNINGQLGNGTTVNNNTLQNVTNNWGGATEILKVTGGYAYYDGSGHGEGITVMLKANNSLYICGNNNWGQCLGNSTTNYVIGGNRTIPFLVPGSYREVAAFGGGSTSIHAITTSNQLNSWGYNAYGQLGDGTTIYRATIYNNLSDVDRVWVDGWATHSWSFQNSAFITRFSPYEGLYGTGLNIYGQLGCGDATNKNTFTRVNLPENINNPEKIKFIGFFSTNDPYKIIILITSDNKIYAWGSNINNGILESNSMTYVATPIQFELSHPD